jgi:hypothetical protein
MCREAGVFWQAALISGSRGFRVSAVPFRGTWRCDLTFQVKIKAADAVAWRLDVRRPVA